MQKTGETQRHGSLAGNIQLIDKEFCSMDMNEVKSKIREIPDWPKQGVNFKDITPVLADPVAFQFVIDELAKPYLDKEFDLIVGIDARGFLLASALAYKLNKGLVIVRKQGKLPYKTFEKEYALEYASNIIEMHVDSIKPGQKVIIIDDVLATGGTMKATVDLVNELSGDIVGISFLIDLTFLKGREKLEGYNIYSLIDY